MEAGHQKEVSHSQIARSGRRMHRMVVRSRKSIEAVQSSSSGMGISIDFEWRELRLLLQMNTPHT